MGRTVELNSEQGKKILDYDKAAAERIFEAAHSNLLPTNRFIFFAAFDGTGNTLKNQPKANEQTTNVAQLWDQYGMEGRFGGGYFAGPGTPGTIKQSAWMSSAVTAQVQKGAAQAYEAFEVQALKWLSKPGAEQAVSVVVTAFSRGCASAAIFSQLLYEKGLSHPDGRQIIAPKKMSVSAGVLFDPVTTGVKCSVAFAPASTNIVCIRAMNEYRHLFPPTQYVGQAGVTTIDMIGNHCNIGGGYDNGISALALDAATRFFQETGLSALMDVPPNRRFKAPHHAKLVYSEGALNGENDPERTWDAYRNFECHPDDFLAATRIP